jgi:hypothetical protein
MEAWRTRPGILILLLLASMGYVVFGGALEVPPPIKPGISVAVAAAEPADVGRTPHGEKVPGGATAPAN